MNLQCQIEVEMAVRGLWLQYYGLKLQSQGRNALPENGAFLAVNQPQDDLPEPTGFMVAT